MAKTTAKTKKDVDELSAKDRLYDSLSYSYGKKGEKIEKNYNQAISQQDRNLLKRGMQRSSYGASTLSGLLSQKNEALDDNESQLIADYENRLGEAEDKERAADQWERQFAESQRQYNESLAYNKERAAAADEQWNQQFGYQKERDTVADTQWQKQYDEQQRQFNENMAYNKERAAASDEQWQKSYEEGTRQFNEQLAENQRQHNEQLAESQRQYNESMAYNRERAAVADEQWKSSYDENKRQFDEQFAENLRQYNASMAENQRQFNENLAYNKDRAAVSDEQWQKTYDENLRQFNEQFAETKRQYDESLKYNRERATAADEQWLQEYNANRSDTAWQQAFNEKQFEAQQEAAKWQQEFSEKQFEAERADTAWQQAFTEKQFEEQVAEWNKEFDYNKMSDEQKINYNYVTYALEHGSDVSDELLEKAGLSREDYEAMKQDVTAISGTGGYNPNDNPGDETPEWQRLGFDNEDDYKDALSKGITDPDEYYKDVVEDEDTPPANSWAHKYDKPSATEVAGLTMLNTIKTNNRLKTSTESAPSYNTIQSAAAENLLETVSKLKKKK